MTKTRKPLRRNLWPLKEQDVTTSLVPPVLGKGGRPASEPRSILKKSVNPQGETRNVRWVPVASVKKFSQNDKIIKNKKDAEMKNDYMPDVYPPNENTQKIVVDLSDVPSVPAVEKSPASYWEEQARRMTLEMPPKARGALFDKLGELCLAIQVAETAHANGEGCEKVVREAYARLKEHVCQNLTTALEQKENRQYWVDKIGEVKKAVEDNDCANLVDLDKAIEDNEFADLVDNIFKIHGQIKQMGRNRAHLFNTGKIIKEVKSAIKFQHRLGEDDQKTFTEKLNVLKDIHAQLDAELKEYQAQECFEEQAREHIKELVNLEPDSAKKELARESYEGALKQLSTSTEIFEYGLALGSLIRKHPMTPIKKPIDQTKKKKGRWFELFCPALPAGDTSPSSSATESPDKNKKSVQMARTPQAP
ncbi:MAG TPA: hypothetical protein VLJ15_00445 [Gammaproteobacteria bacterium]|nr:hypothetical protein [Gammaproteobacteria bacterium]